jgi:hypothetical protein
VIRTGYRVAIIPPGGSIDPLGATCTIIVVNYDGAKPRVLMPDSSWTEINEGEVAPAGLVLPAEAMDALIDAIDRYRGAPSHAKTEAAVLREWLAAEQARVDKVFEAVGRPIEFAGPSR